MLDFKALGYKCPTSAVLHLNEGLAASKAHEEKCFDYGTCSICGDNVNSHNIAHADTQVTYCDQHWGVYNPRKHNPIASVEVDILDEGDFLYTVQVFVNGSLWEEGLFYDLEEAYLWGIGLIEYFADYKLYEELELFH